MYVPDWACRRYGDYEHDWLDCPECLATYEAVSEVEIEWQRASGLCVCACGKLFYDHPQHPVFSWLNVTCDGQVWKF
jgi:hypothetical protein